METMIGAGSPSEHPTGERPPPPPLPASHLSANEQRPAAAPTASSYNTISNYNCGPQPSESGRPAERRQLDTTTTTTTGALVNDSAHSVCAESSCGAAGALLRGAHRSDPAATSAADDLLLTGGPTTTTTTEAAPRASCSASRECRLSSAADLNCRHLIRSPPVADSGSGAALASSRRLQGNELAQREECVAVSVAPTTTARQRRRDEKRETKKKKKKLEAEGGDGAPDALFKRAASAKLTTRRLSPLPLLKPKLPSLVPSFVSTSSGHRCAASSGSGSKVKASLLTGLAVSESIKLESQQQRASSSGSEHSRWPNLGKTIKSLVAFASGATVSSDRGRRNWSRSQFNTSSPPQKSQPANKSINVNKAELQQQQVESEAAAAAAEEKKQDIKLGCKQIEQDAHSIRSDPVVLSLSCSESSSSSLVSSSLLFHEQKNQYQIDDINHQHCRLLPSSQSCELAYSCFQQQHDIELDSQENSSLSKLVVCESNNNSHEQIKQVVVAEQLGQSRSGVKIERSTRRRLRKRTRRLSSVQKVKLQTQYITTSDDNNNNNGSIMSHKVGRSGTNQAKSASYIMADNVFRRLEGGQSKETTDSTKSEQLFHDDRRSAVCSFIAAGTDEQSSDISSTANKNSRGNHQSEINSMMNRHQDFYANQQQGKSNDHNDSFHDQAAPTAQGSPMISKDAKGSDCSRKRPHGFKDPSGSSGGGDEGLNAAVEAGLKKRENWGMNIEFLLAVIGFAVDLGNVWRFPYICYRNGGGAFLIPYTIMFILGGLPIFYLEMSLGQYFSSGCLTVWKRVCPMAKGIGYAMCVLNFFTGLYYNTVISWAVFFFVESFTTILPWTSCNNSWNTGDCKTIDQRQALRKSLIAYNLTSSPSAAGSNDSSVIYSSPTKDYFEREVLQVHLSSGIDDLGSIRRPLAIYLAIVFICIYFAIWKGVKSTGKAVWITALLPYFVLVPLLIRGVFLEGAWLGIRYYLEPQWEKIFDVDVWVEAAKQIYFSLGPGFGTLMALSSYNKFHHNCRRDAFIAASVNYFASFIAGLVVFALLGYMATIMDVSISDVATEGPGLVFQVYPEGLATMRFSSMWSVLFFIMVITLGIDSTFGGLESVITGLCDEYPRVLRAHRGIFIGLLIVLIYFCSLPTTTYGGNYVIYLLESYGTSLSLIFIVLVETIVVCWIYGVDRFCSNLEEMYGERPGAFWRICWKYISPTILLLIFLAACGQEFNKYHILNSGDYIYPSWAPTLGLLMTGSSVCCIPVYAIYYMKTKTSGTFWERLKIARSPEGDSKVVEKDIYGHAMIDKISDENDIHLNVVI